MAIFFTNNLFIHWQQATYLPAENALLSAPLPSLHNQKEPPFSHRGSLFSMSFLFNLGRLNSLDFYRSLAKRTGKQLVLLTFPKLGSSEDVTLTLQALPIAVGEEGIIPVLDQ